MESSNSGPIISLHGEAIRFAVEAVDISKMLDENKGLTKKGVRRHEELRIDADEVRLLGRTASAGLMSALDPVVRGEVPVSDDLRGWAIYMCNLYGRHPRVRPEQNQLNV